MNISIDNYDGKGNRGVTVLLGGVVMLVSVFSDKQRVSFHIRVKTTDRYIHGQYVLLQSSILDRL